VKLTFPVGAVDVAFGAGSGPLDRPIGGAAGRRSKQAFIVSQPVEKVMRRDLSDRRRRHKRYCTVGDDGKNPALPCVGWPVK
jgi:hypothetical protein